MAKGKIIGELIDLSEKLPTLIQKHSAQLDDIQRQMAELKEAGLIYASTHMREGKYFYLVYPVKSGDKRRRDYIGTDKTKIDEALASIARGKAYDALASQLNQYEEYLADKCRVLKQLTESMSRHLR